MEKMHGKRNERCWHDVGGSKQESSRQGRVEVRGCLSVAYTLTGVRGNDDERSTPKVMYRNIEEIIGKKTCSSTGCLKTKEGSIIMDKEKILERWAEYIRELFEDNRKEHDVMKKNFAGPPIMKDEVREAIRKMKTGKATGPDGLSIELIEALEEYAIEKVTTLLNKIYDTGQIPVDMSRSIFIALPKKPGATDCELHRTISLMSHVTKLLLRIIMMRVRNKMNP